MKRPNILLITTDQQRYDTICAAGFDYMSTPNLDQLANEGCLFTNAYSPNPVCIPARHNILSGLPAKYHTFDDNYFDDSHQMPCDIPAFPEILANGGYHTVAIGKMHFQPCKRHNGFDRMYNMEEIPVFREDDDYALYLKENGIDQFSSFHGVRHLLYMLPQQAIIPTKYHGTTWVADKTIETIKTNGDSRPFMIWTSFIQPHPPFDVPKQWAHLYDNVKLPKGYASLTPLSALAEENKHIADYPNDDYLQRAKQLYHSAISFVDDNIGRIITCLKNEGLLDDTLIIFTSDHGEMLGDNGTFQKFLPYDGASKIPFIVRYPKLVKANTIDERLIDLNDLLPTFLDVAKLDYPKAIELPGENIFNVDGKKDRDYQYIEHNKGNKRWISLRNKHYKYNYYYGGGHEELFDLINDKQERSNLLFDCQDEKVLAIKKQLRTKLIQYEQKWGFTGGVVNGDFVCLAEYLAKPYRETNFPHHVQYLSQAEQAHLIGMINEIKLAIKNEPIVKLRDLDIDTFKDNGHFLDAELCELLDE